MQKSYKVIVADPPWDLRFGKDSNRALRKSTGSAKGTWGDPAMGYPVMTLDEIASLPVASLAAADSHLYLWVVNRYIEQAYGIARSWGFRPVTLLTWAKTPRGLGLGGAFVQTTEHILFARKGKQITTTRKNTTWWNWTRPETGTGPVHSRKPEELQSLIESITPGPYLELFARRKRPGWDTWGNEILPDIQMSLTPRMTSLS